MTNNLIFHRQYLDAPRQQAQSDSGTTTYQQRPDDLCQSLPDLTSTLCYLLFRSSQPVGSQHVAQPCRQQLPCHGPHPAGLYPRRPPARHHYHRWAVRMPGQARQFCWDLVWRSTGAPPRGEPQQPQVWRGADGGEEVRAGCGDTRSRTRQEVKDQQPLTPDLALTPGMAPDLAPACCKLSCNSPCSVQHSIHHHVHPQPCCSPTSSPTLQISRSGGRAWRQLLFKYSLKDKVDMVIKVILWID